MLSQLVFQEAKEIERLSVQNRLLAGYEQPILAQLFDGRGELAVLDVGCSNGAKTAKRFSSDSVSCVIGLEYIEGMAAKAQENYGNEKFSFYPCDVMAPGFQERLTAIMRQRNIDGFDVIYLSFVLMHLSDAEKLLRELRPFLKPDGQMLIIEADDAASALNGDEGGLLGAFLEILDKDPYSGNRRAGGRLSEMVLACGYEIDRVWHDCISAGAGETEKKQAILTTFFSYLPEDVTLLLDEQPDSREYRAWKAWLEDNFEALKEKILRQDSVISMGMKILTCTRDEI